MEPSEDFAHAVITYKDRSGKTVILEVTTSWCFVGAGLRLSFEMLGPEYSLKANTLNTGLDVFLSRNIKAQQSEDLIEKQNAEIGLMPVVPYEAATYGYSAENRHMVQCFLNGEPPLLQFADGVEVVQLLMACYKSAETGQTVYLNSSDLTQFIPAVAKGSWIPGATTSP